MRGEGIGTPIVVVSARGTESDRIRALEIGADDYLVKPFAMGGGWLWWLVGGHF